MIYSYTIMSTIEATGKLLLLLSIVMQEISGSFGPLVKQNLFAALNIYLTASQSGKMTKDHLKTWLEDVYFPNGGNRIVLVIDFWSTNKNQALLNAATPEGREVQVVTIPAKTTSLCHPLNVYSFCM
ncbi:hypothetical protein BV898_08812 [Hypsibius exemplaris]|uniref:DDE-1 domain-containing protein n=1 Tax=Hypsibius exemplaris TaxID=2072580 RepID=A0A1W0WPG1_HYPEX|nr:hypothetical protein BV898_08812 [Hypsibius exemplaris]